MQHYLFPLKKLFLANAFVVCLLIALVSVISGAAMVYNADKMPKRKQIPECININYEYGNSKSFFEDLNKCSTQKYVINDAGFFLIIVGLGFVPTVFALRHYQRQRKTPGLFVIHSLNALAGISLFIGFIIGIYVSLPRGVYPTWEDSIAIPIFGLVITYPFFLSISTGVLTALLSHYKKGVEPQFSFKKLPYAYKVYFIITFLIGIFTLYQPIFDSSIAFILYLTLNIFLYAGIKREKSSKAVT